MHKLHTCAYFFCEIPTNFEKCFQKITVIIKTAGFTHFCNTNALCKQGFGNGNASCGNVFVDRCAGRGFKDTADIRFTDKKCAAGLF